MNILSEPFKDTTAIEQHSGGYEWWYFDGASADGEYHFVIIFYRGNPFSTRYITALEKQSEIDPMPSEYPGISISIYEKGEPIYYSFTEFDETDSNMKQNGSRLMIGDHSMKGERKNNQLAYTLHLEEQLPCGDQIEADITFESSRSLLHFDDGASMPGSHCWNLVQPRAEVEANVKLILQGTSNRDFSFTGTGYHDQNAGKEPLKNEFIDWYWGRFHFHSATLIYYMMNPKDGQEEQYSAWLLNPGTHEIVDQLDEIEPSDQTMSIFGLTSSRKLNLKSEQAKIQIQQSTLVDNGPFYQRYLSEGFLNIPGENVLESTRGITEYLRPGRIYTRLFWPLVNMRIRQAHAKPHWVQRSKKLYRWTW